MIGRLRGKIVEESADGTILLDVAGVGYEVSVPLGAVGRIADREDATLYVHTHAREDALTLFGFDTADDKAAFRALLTVNSIGPKLAMAILSHLSAAELAEVVAREDKAALKGISGVGRKTVERIMLDLQGKLLVAATSSGTRRAPAPVATPGAPSGNAVAVVGALVQMGYKRADAERAVGVVTEGDTEERPTEAILRDALGALS